MSGGLAEVAARLAAAPAPIAYLGHSVTAQRDGYRPHLHAGLVSRFGQPHPQINAGFGGVGSVVSACVTDQSVIRRGPALCFIECMTGDLGVGLHPDTGPALEGILRKLARAGCAACFLNLPRRGMDFAPGNPIVDLYAGLAARYQTPVVDLASALSGEGEDYFRDVVHTTPEGGRRTAALILAALDPIFAAPATAGPGRPPLFARDFLDASVSPARTAQLSVPAAGANVRFRLAAQCVEFGPDNEITFLSDDHELLGVLAVTGPHSGPTRVNDRVLQLSDRWSHHYERLHGVAFQTPFAPGDLVRIAPLERAGNLPARLKLNAFLVRPI